MRIARFFGTVAVLASAGVAAVALIRVLETQIEAGIYRERLVAIESDLADLREQYNRAVRKTAVTELVVDDGTLFVSVRAADGTTHTLPTPFDPSLEIYVDYVVLDGRLWIRRLFDQNTPPGEGMLVDPGLADIDWETDGVALGKAAYRALGEGRWVVSVSGDGSLGLVPAREGERVELAPPPAIREFAPVADETRSALRELEAEEIIRVLAQRLTPRAAVQ